MLQNAAHPWKQQCNPIRKTSSHPWKKYSSTKWCREWKKGHLMKKYSTPKKKGMTRLEFWTASLNIYILFCIFFNVVQQFFSEVQLFSCSADFFHEVHCFFMGVHFFWCTLFSLRCTIFFAWGCTFFHEDTIYFIGVQHFFQGSVIFSTRGLFLRTFFVNPLYTRGGGTFVLPKFLSSSVGSGHKI